LVVSRESEGDVPSVAFLDSATLEVVAQQRLDPDEFLPYDKGKYRSFKRDTYTETAPDSDQERQITDTGIRTTGIGLEDWIDLDFDPGTGVLTLWAYRPEGEPFEYRGENTFFANPRAFLFEVCL